MSVVPRRPVALFAALTGIAVACATAPAAAVVIQFGVFDLPDAVAGQDHWQYEYRLDGFPLPAGSGFSTLFPAGAATDLALVGSVPPGWDPIVLQPDPQLPDPGRYDAQATQSSPPTDAGFLVSFVWSGPGAPRAQAFEIYDARFAVIETGLTVPVPEPGAALEVGLGALALAAGRRLRRRLAPHRSV